MPDICPRVLIFKRYIDWNVGTSDTPICSYVNQENRSSKRDERTKRRSAHSQDVIRLIVFGGVIYSAGDW